MNAAVLVYGHQSGRGGGRARRLEPLASSRRVSDAARFSPFQRGPLDVLLGRWTLTIPFADVCRAWISCRAWSRPTTSNPMGQESIARDLAEAIDFKVLAQSPIHLFITATNVRTGRGKVFKNDAVTPIVLLAFGSAPRQSVPGDRDRRRGLLGRRLFRQSDADPARPRAQVARYDSRPINPIERPGIPRSASEILNRLNEVSFNAVVLKELRMMALLRKVADPGDGEGRLWTEMRVHVVRNNIMTELGSSSKLNAEWQFFSFLRDEGRKAAEAFLDAHAMDLGKRSTLDIDVLLEGV